MRSLGLGLLLSLAVARPGGAAVTTVGLPLVGAAAPGGAATTVAILAGGRVLCSGAVVSPDAVLTAAHCFPEGAQTMETQLLEICTGHAVDACDVRAPVVAIHVHPSYDERNFDFDYAVVRTATSLAVEPAGLGNDAPSVLRIEGFGRTEAFEPTTSGFKRSVAVPVTAVTGDRLVYGEATCSGDSGGPAYDPRDGAVVGVTSSGPVGCRSFGRSVRVAPAREWIVAMMTAPLVSKGSLGNCAAAPRGRPPVGPAILIVLVAGFLRRLCRRTILLPVPVP